MLYNVCVIYHPHLCWCVAVVCCSSVLQECVAVVCCSSVLQMCIYQIPSPRPSKCRSRAANSIHLSHSSCISCSSRPPPPSPSPFLPSLPPASRAPRVFLSADTHSLSYIYLYIHICVNTHSLHKSV